MPLSLSPGDVIFLFSPKAGKWKRVILVARKEDEFLAVFINSEQNAFVNSESVLRDLHPKFELTGRPYLDHDSFVDCSDPDEYSLNQIVNALLRDTNNLLGTLSSSDLSMITEKVKTAYTVERDIRKKYFGEDAVPRRQPRPRIKKT